MRQTVVQKFRIGRLVIAWATNDPLEAAIARIGELETLLTRQGYELGRLRAAADKKKRACK